MRTGKHAQKLGTPQKGYQIGQKLVLGIFLDEKSISNIFRGMKNLSDTSLSNFHYENFLGNIPLVGVPSIGQSQKILSDSSSPWRKTPEYKNSYNLETILKIQFFLPLVPKGKKSNFQNCFQLF